MLELPCCCTQFSASTPARGGINAALSHNIEVADDCVVLWTLPWGFQCAPDGEGEGCLAC